jgi:hypothetical protein
MSAIETSRLEIRRFHAEYLVSRDHPGPERLKSRLDDAVTHALAENLAGVLSRCFSDSDPTVWFIRRLNFAIDTNAVWDAQPLSRAWARELGANLHATLQDGPDGENVLRFPNRAAYLSRFLIDVVAGRAWTKWYYESFSGLRPLPTSGVVRTVVCENPEIGLSALHQLTARELEEISQVLTLHDARAILDAISGLTAADASSCFLAAREAWDRMENIFTGAEEQWRNALRLYVDASRGRRDVGGLNLKTAVVELSRSLPATKNLGAANRYAEAVLRHTAFGGMFLLLPLIDELPLVDATRQWPGAEDTDAVTLVRFLLLMKCCGRSRADRAFYDPLLRDLMAIAPSVSAKILADWRQKIFAPDRKVLLTTLADWHEQRGAAIADVLGPRRKLRKDVAYLSLPQSLGLSWPLDFALSIAAQTVMRAFARRLPGFAGSNLPYLYSNFLDCPASEEEEADRRIVRLGRPPLDLILNMTGMSRQSYRLSWHDERPFALFSADE